MKGQVPGKNNIPIVPTTPPLFITATPSQARLWKAPRFQGPPQASPQKPGTPPKPPENKDSTTSALLEIFVTLAGILSDTLFWIGYPFLFLYNGLKRFSARNKSSETKPFAS